MLRRRILIVFAATVSGLGYLAASMACMDSIRANGEEFAIAVLPDTQYYSQTYSATFEAQTQWIVDNREALNIVYVAHEGDIVQTSTSTEQWETADVAMSLLEDPVTTGLEDGIPYGVLPGNHDQPTTNYNTYFGEGRFAGRGYYGGHYGTDNDNNYGLFSAGDLDFIVVNLEYNPSSDALVWADALLEFYSGRRAIVVSHFILELDGSFSSIGQTIYDALKDNRNLFLMLCGHRHTEARRSDIYQGYRVHSLLADYQDLPQGGNGYLRILLFSPEANEIRVQTYSPTLDQYLDGGDSQFDLNWPVTRKVFFLPFVVREVE